MLKNQAISTACIQTIKIEQKMCRIPSIGMRQMPAAILAV
jgi:hypothetical protein